jgi:hypothetical protein
VTEKRSLEGRARFAPALGAGQRSARVSRQRSARVSRPRRRPTALGAGLQTPSSARPQVSPSARRGSPDPVVDPTEGLLFVARVGLPMERGDQAGGGVRRRAPSAGDLRSGRRRGQETRAERARKEETFGQAGGGVRRPAPSAGDLRSGRRRGQETRAERRVSRRRGQETRAERRVPRVPVLRNPCVPCGGRGVRHPRARTGSGVPEPVAPGDHF